MIDVENNNKGQLLLAVLQEEGKAVEVYKHEDIMVFKRRLLQLLPTSVFIGHNIKHDVKIIYKNTGVLIEQVRDTMIASQMLYNGLDLSHSLDEVCYRVLNVKLNKGMQKQFLKMSILDPITEEMIAYATNDIKYLAALDAVFVPLLQRDELYKAYTEIEMPLVPILAKMESNPTVLIDVPKWQRMIKSWEAKLIDIEEKIKAILLDLCKKETELLIVANETIMVYKASANRYIPFNINSSEHIAAVFKTFVGTPPKGKSKASNSKGYSVGKDALLEFVKSNPSSVLSDLIKLILQQRKQKKLLTTYGDKLLSSLDSRNALTTSYGTTFTATNRLNSSKVNLQNIPGTAEVRSCFIAPPGHKVLKIDFSQQELRLAASQSGDTLVINELKPGYDLHSTLGSISYNVLKKPSEYVHLTPKQNPEHDAFRKKHKQVVFGYIYGATEHRISEILDCSTAEAKEILKAIGDKVPKLKKYLESAAQEALQKGYIVINDMYKRRRYFSKRDANAVSRESGNAKIQGSGADMCKLCLIECDKYLTKTQSGYISMTVHDEIVFHIKDGNTMQTTIDSIVKIMRDTSALFYLPEVSPELEYHVGDTWV